MHAFRWLLSVLTVTACSRRALALDAVMLTTAKDTRAFEKSIASALKYLVDVNDYYVVTPHRDQLLKKFGKALGDRVKFVDEGAFPFNGYNVSEIMIESVRERGVYPLNDKSQFEHTVWGRIGWFLQQLLKFYAGKVLNIGDYVLLDSDLVWFRNVTLINGTIPGASSNDGANASFPPAFRYNYASSSQYHPAYMAVLSRVTGMQPYETKDNIHRSGIVHHMVIVKTVLDSLMNDTEHRYQIPFWQVLLNESARELTCRAPRQGICGGGSTLSEYELYFSYARHRFPETVSLRPLLWANGPSPGLQYWPPLDGQIHPDGRKGSWLGHRQQEVPAVLLEQIEADRLQGYDYVGYHGYSKRRYFELVGVDIEELCNDAPQPYNTTCSWRGLEERNMELKKLGELSRTKEEWFRGCACYMANHQSGP